MDYVVDAFGFIGLVDLCNSCGMLGTIYVETAKGSRALKLKAINIRWFKTILFFKCKHSIGTARLAI